MKLRSNAFSYLQFLSICIENKKEIGIRGLAGEGCFWQNSSGFKDFLGSRVERGWCSPCGLDCRSAS